MGIEFKAREYIKNDESQVLELLELVFERKVSSDYWNWKYFDTRLAGQSVVVTHIEDQIIGVSGGFYLETKLGENIYLTQYGGDEGVHPDYRRMGVATKMEEIQKKIIERDGVKLFTAVSTNPIVIKNRNKKKRPPFPKKILEMVYVEDIKNTDWPLFKRLGYGVYKKTRKLLKGNNHVDRITEFTETDSFGAEADVFWNKIVNYYSLMFKRDSNFLNWRYCDPRSGIFKVLSRARWV